jgi:streptogramin lyase
VYVADAGNGRVQRLTHEGAHDRSYSWTQVGDPPDLDVVGLEPHLAALDDGRIVVSLSLLGELRVLEPESGAWSVWSVGRPALLEPVGLAADGRGGLWVADRALNRVARIRLEE